MGAQTALDARTDLRIVNHWVLLDEVLPEHGCDGRWVDAWITTAAEAAKTGHLVPPAPSAWDCPDRLPARGARRWNLPGARHRVSRATSGASSRERDDRAAPDQHGDVPRPHSARSRDLSAHTWERWTSTGTSEHPRTPKIAREDDSLYTLDTAVRLALENPSHAFTTHSVDAACPTPTRRAAAGPTALTGTHST